MPEYDRDHHEHGGHVPAPFLQQGVDGAPELESLDTTFAEDGQEIFFATGYSAREIAQRHAREKGGQIYVNNISRKLRRRAESTSSRKRPSISR